MAYLQRRNLSIKAVSMAERVRVRYKIDRVSPIDIISIIHNCGCDIKFMTLPSLEGLYSPVPRATIIIGSQRPAGRRNYTCAHELGHHLFKHGTCIDQLNQDGLKIKNQPNEFLADMFAGYLLMPQSAIKRTLKERKWLINDLTAIEIYTLSSYFGVGYTTIIEHLRWTLKILNEKQYHELLKIQPRQIKYRYYTEAKNELFIVDFHWQTRAIDLEIGDSVCFPANIIFDNMDFFKIIETNNKKVIASPIKTGYTRVLHNQQNWSVNIRISRKNYNGLAVYRFLEDGEEGDQL